MLSAMNTEPNDDESDLELEQMMIAALEERIYDEGVTASETIVEQPIQTQMISTTTAELEDNEPDLELEQMILGVLEDEGHEDTVTAAETIVEQPAQVQMIFTTAIDLDDNEPDLELEQMMLTALDDGNGDEVVAAAETNVEHPGQNQLTTAVPSELYGTEWDLELEQVLAELMEGNGQGVATTETVAEQTVQNQLSFSTPIDPASTTHGAREPQIMIDPELESYYKPEEAATLSTAPESEIKPFTDEEWDNLFKELDAEFHQSNKLQPQQPQSDPFNTPTSFFEGSQAQQESASNSSTSSVFIFSATPQAQAPKPDIKSRECLPSQLPPPTGNQIFRTPAQVAQRDKAVPKSIASRVAPNFRNRSKETPKSIRARLARRNIENLTS